MLGTFYSDYVSGDHITLDLKVHGNQDTNAKPTVSAAWPAGRPESAVPAGAGAPDSGREVGPQLLQGEGSRRLPGVPGPRAISTSSHRSPSRPCVRHSQRARRGLWGQQAQLAPLCTGAPHSTVRQGAGRRVPVLLTTVTGNLPNRERLR